ncbi:MAG TPA: GGDEF domain-containing protein [Allosphingosinicella sp.]|jgi:diguanylate cyclase (GGDEF)-like protein
MSKLSPFEGAERVGAEDENALLRAALADAQARLEALEAAAEADPLTGLPNARRFGIELDRAVGTAARHGTEAVLLSIDVKGLDAVNAAYGRIGGDTALRHVARLLSGLIRATDSLAHTGGGSFALILAHIDHNSAIDAAERLARCIAAEPADLGSARIRVEARIAATSILPGDSAEDVLRRAQANLARAKQGY